MLYNDFQNNSVFRLSKGMASRHLFTHAYRIHCTRPTKAFCKPLLNGLVPLSRNARCSEARLRQLHLAVPAPVRFAVQISVVLKKSGKEGFLYDSL